MLRTFMLITSAAALLFALSSTSSTVKIQPTTTLAAERANKTSTASFAAQSNGNAGPGNVSKISLHGLLSPANSTKVYAHWMGWFGSADHMNVGYSSTDPAAGRNRNSGSGHLHAEQLR